MASVKLFRDTEFAGSIFQSPLANRTALHPLALMVLVAVWLATVGHWPLWHTLLLRTEPGATGPLLAVATVTQLAVAGLIWMSVSCWRWTFKTALTLLLLWTALGCSAMWAQSAAGEAVAMTPADLWRFLSNPAQWHKLASWPSLLSLTVVAVIPSVLIWRGRVRRVPLGYQLLQNALVLIASIAVFVGLSGRLSHTMPSPLILTSGSFSMP